MDGFQCPLIPDGAIRFQQGINYGNRQLIMVYFHFEVVEDACQVFHSPEIAGPACGYPCQERVFAPPAFFDV